MCEPSSDRRQDFQVSIELRVSASEPRPTVDEPSRRALASDVEPEASARLHAVDPARAAAAYLAQSQLMAEATRPRSRELHVRA